MGSTVSPALIVFVLFETLCMWSSFLVYILILQATQYLSSKFTFAEITHYRLLLFATKNKQRNKSKQQQKTLKDISIMNPFWDKVGYK